MRRVLILLAGVVLGLSIGAGPALATEPDGSAAQVAGESASSGQDAGAASGALQSGPSNESTGDRVLSPGKDGDLTQSNDATAIGVAKNDNDTDQSVDQSQTGGGYGSDYSQVAGQEASNDQDAEAEALAVQEKPSNRAIDVRVLSPGNGGDVTQSNSSTAIAAGLNDNDTDQSVDQSQTGGGSGYGSDYSQVAGQEASSEQSADADATAIQLKPSNESIRVRVLSPGKDGDLTQSNDATAIGVAKNDNDTDQSVDQSQTGGGYGSDYSQVAGQEASNDQDAEAEALAVQEKPSNRAIDVRVLSPGNGGDVTQSNSSTAIAAGLNDNDTDQSVDQSQTGGGSGYGSDYSQVAGQEASSEQSADADATAIQLKPSNESIRVRVLSPGKDGDLTQSNDATAIGVAKNDNDTDQSVDQSQTGGGYGSDRMDGKKKGDKGSDYLQVAGQEASNWQNAEADAKAIQLKPSNESIGVRVLSPGSDGDVTQSNSSTAIAAGLNDNDTDQSIDQSQKGGGYGSDYAQDAGQSSWNGQSADAGALSLQFGASNTNAPIRVLSPGHGGDVTQSNDATAIGVAKNDNDTDQSVDQSQTGGGYGSDRMDGKKKGDKGSDYLQVAGQEASNWQNAEADAKAIQLKPSNESIGVRVLSPGSDGDVTQSNSSTAIAAGLNDNDTDQSIDQSQKGGGYGSDYAQDAGQSSWNGQSADAGALSLQFGASNTNAPIRVLSPGHGGDVTQSNDATAIGVAKNDNDTMQTIGQSQMGGGYGSDYLQVAGQAAWSDQRAHAGAFALQAGASNLNTPVRVLSPGHDGDVSQSNSSTAIAAGLNFNKTDQTIRQSQTGGGHGSLYLQAAGQEAWNGQWAGAKALALQIDASNTNAPVRVGSPGGGGSVEQSNDVTALAIAANLNLTDQSIGQTQSGGGFDALYLQAAGQRSSSWQGAFAGAFAAQLGASNEHIPVRVGSPGSCRCMNDHTPVRGGSPGSCRCGNDHIQVRGGSPGLCRCLVDQSNSVGSVAAGLNFNKTDQDIHMSQVGGGHGSLYLQAAGQDDWAWQLGHAFAFALGGGMHNR